MSSIDSRAGSLGDPFGDGAFGVGHHPSAPDAAASAAAAAAEVARLGVPAPGAPNGRVLPCDLGALDEDALLGPGRTARLYAVADRPEDFRPEREPLILVHGIKGDPSDMQPIVDRLRGDDRFQVYVLCYDDYHRRTGRNGVDLAQELRALSQGTLGAGRPVSIVAHSMGGIVARRALNELTVDSQRSIDRFSQVRLIAADTPWHGFPGPADNGLGSIAMAFARPFMPDGLEDMRAESALFRGDPGASGAAARAGLYGVDLPAHVRTDVVFAERGDQALDYTEPPLSRLPGLIAANMRDEVRNPIRGEARLENHWRALVQSSRFPAFRIELERCLREGRLDESAVRSALERHFPRFPGSHVGVLGAPGSAGAPSFLDHLEGLLAPPPG